VGLEIILTTWKIDRFHSHWFDFKILFLYVDKHCLLVLGMDWIRVACH